MAAILSVFSSSVNLQKKYTQWAGLLWIVFVFVICITALPHSHRSVSQYYWKAAQHWLSGAPLYDGTGTGFIYLPQSAILYIPFGLLPFRLSELLWRIFSLTIFAWGLYRFSFLIQKLPGLYFFIMTLIVIPIGFSAARNGQMHVLTAGLFMLVCADLPEQKWWKIAILLILALALKTPFIVFVLLLGALYWPIAWRLIFLAFVFFLLPFLLQSPHYVIAQYLAGIQNLSITQHMPLTGQEWAQPFGTFLVWGWSISQSIQTEIRIIFAFLVFSLGYLLKRRCPSVQVVALHLFALSICYLLLFNPRVEGNDYIMLVPVMALVLMDAWLKKRIFFTGVVLLVLFVLIDSYYLAKAILPGHIAWIEPLVGVFFFVLTLSSVFKSLTVASSP